MKRMTVRFLDQAGKLGVFVGLAFFLVSLVPNSSGGNDASREFTNRAGQPIMAVDMDRVANRPRDADTASWTEGHRWDPRIRRKHRWKDPGTSRTGLLNSRSRLWLNKPTRVFLFSLLIGMLAVRIILGVVVYRDLSVHTTTMSSLWVLVVLFAGTLGAIAYALFRLVNLSEQGGTDPDCDD